MANLPADRVTPSRPFFNCGVDYAGPINIRLNKGRGHKSFKGYIALFVCFSVKAIHLEPVTDLTSQGFLAAFKRFASRRGIPSNLFSDNGTNFVGANRELTSDLIRFNNQFHDELAQNLTLQGTQWHFIPAASPHFGGLWEAGVKSVKHHLRRIVGLNTLTLEELLTLLCKIEATLNSRPLYPLSSDPHDYEALTPGHFLVGTALNAIPEPSVLEIPQHRLSRWQFVQQLYQSFWRIWKRDYLYTLQQRTKWTIAKGEVNIGDLVLIKEESLPPSKWLLGRITDLHPGADGRTRVVSVKTAQNTLQRPIVKICVLPVS